MGDWERRIRKQKGWGGVVRYFTYKKKDKLPLASLYSIILYQEERKSVERKDKITPLVTSDATRSSRAIMRKKKNI